MENTKPAPLVPLNEQARNFLGNAISFFEERYGHMWQEDTKRLSRELLETMLKRDH